MDQLDLKKYLDKKLILMFSGGVDSVVLLSLLTKSLDKDNLLLLNIDYGNQNKNKNGKVFIEECSKQYGIKLVTKKYDGQNVSEESLRDFRYGYAKEVQNDLKYDYIVTGQHKDDLVETTVLNIIRGTGTYGILNMLNNKEIERPLLGVSKLDIYMYSSKFGLDFMQDLDNFNFTDERSFIRNTIMPLINIDKFYDQVLILRDINSLIVSRINEEINASEKSIKISKEYTNKLSIELIANIVSVINNTYYRGYLSSKHINRIAMWIKSNPETNKKVSINKNKKFVISKGDSLYFQL